MKQRGGSPEREHEREGALARIAAAVRRRPTMLVGIGIFASVVVLWLWRVQHGVDLSDESLYLAIPMRFALGDRPFLDDRSSLQGAGMLTVPLAFVYHLVVRSHAGFVLFMRVAYVAFLAGLGAAVARSMRGWLAPASALATGALVCFFAPYTIAQFSYNTLGAGLTLLAAVSSLRVARSTTPREAGLHAVLGGVAAAGAVLAYPTMFMVFPVHLLTLLLFGRAHLGALRVGLRFVAGAALVGLYVGLFLLRSGFGSLRLTLEFIRAWGPMLGNTVTAVVDGVNALKTDWFSSLAIAAALTALATRFRPAVLLLAVAVPFLAAPKFQGDNAEAMRFFSCCALFAPFFGVLVRDRKNAFRVLAIVWAPGMLTGFVMGYSSGNIWNACGLGGFTAMLAGCLLACRACEESVGTLRIFVAPFGLVAPLALLYVLVARMLAPEAAYRDVAPSATTVRVGRGPFAGLRTTAARRTLVEAMHDDIVGNTRASRFVLFLPDMVSGYLSTNARPAVPELWMSGKAGRSAIDAQVYRERVREIGLVMVRACEPSKPLECSPVLSNPSDPFQAAVLETHVEASRRFDYAILKPR